MKFLCVECDEAMRLEGTEGPDRGSMTVVFTCPSCGRRTAMLTNTMETQVVRSLGVKIGGRTVPSEPMEMVRGNLVGGHANGVVGTHVDDALGASAAIEDEEPASDPGAPSPSSPAPASHGEAPSRPHPHPTDPPQEASKCPFTGMVNEAFAQQESVGWTEGARRRMERIPEFARRMVMKGVEDTARAQGLDEVNEALLDDVRGQFGM